MNDRAKQLSDKTSGRDMRPRLLMVFEKPRMFGYLGEEYLRAFYENGWHVTVCYLCGEIDEPYRSRLPVHEALSFNLSKKQVRGLKIPAIWQMARLLGTKHFDLVVSHQYKANTSVGVAGLLRPNLKKYAVFHGIKPTTAFSRKLFYSTIGRFFTRFITVSNTQYQNIRKSCFALPIKKFSVIRNTIYIDCAVRMMHNQQEARRALGLKSDDFVIGLISRLTEDKRPLDLVYAFKMIAQNLPKARLVIIGTGNQKVVLADEAERLGLNEKLILPGYIEEAWKLLKAFDVFVFPSELESCGLVLLEAMSAKVPIIASRSQCIQETLNNVGYFVNTRDYNDLAEKIYYIYKLENNERNSVVESGFQWVRSEYDKDIFQAKLLNTVNADFIELNNN